MKGEASRGRLFLQTWCSTHLPANLPCQVHHASHKLRLQRRRGWGSSKEGEARLGVGLSHLRTIHT